jgi:CBS domain-containing protein
MPGTDSETKASRELIDRLKAVRDTARLHAHLLSLDARTRFRDLEASVDELEAQLARNSGKIAEIIPQKARQVAQAIADLLRDAAGSAELKTPVSAVMNDRPGTCTPGDSLNRAAQIFWEHDCGAAPVVNHDGRLLGMLTDRDICMASYTRGEPLWAISVMSTMSHAPVCAGPTDSIAAVARLMRDNRVRRIPIVEHERLVGVVALADIARHIRHHAPHSLPASITLAHTLAEISEEPGAAQRAAE